MRSCSRLLQWTVVLAGALLLLYASNRTDLLFVRVNPPSTSRLHAQSNHLRPAWDLVFDPCRSLGLGADDSSERELLQASSCYWQWSDDPPTSPPLLRWEKLYSIRFTAEFLVNALGDKSFHWRSRTQQLLTRNLSVVSEEKVATGDGPFPVLVTTTDFSDLRRSAQVALNVVVAVTVDHKTWNMLSVAVDLSTLAIVDIGNKCSGFGWGTWHCPDMEVAMPRLYHRIFLAVTGKYPKRIKKAQKLFGITTLPATSPPARGYLSGLDWFPPTPGHTMDDLVQLLCAHSTSKRNPVILLPAMLRYANALGTFINFFKKYYQPFDVVWLERDALYRGNVTFAPLQDTGHTPSAVHFMTTHVIPHVMEDHRRRGTAIVRRPIMAKLAGASPGSQKEAIRFGKTFRDRAEAEGWTFALAGATPLDLRAYWLNTAETVLLSWGGTMTVTMYLYAQRTEPLHIILLVPFQDVYWAEAIVLSLAGGGRKSVRVWYVEGWELHHFSFPNTRMKLVFLPTGNADDLEAADLQFPRDVFTYQHEADVLFFSQWSEDTANHELASRRMLGANRVAQASTSSRASSRRRALDLLERFCRLRGPRDDDKSSADLQQQQQLCTVPTSYRDALTAGVGGSSKSLFSSNAAISSVELLDVKDAVVYCLSLNSSVAVASRHGMGIIRESTPCLEIMVDSADTDPKKDACVEIDFVAMQLHQQLVKQQIQSEGGGRRGTAVWALGGTAEGSLGDATHDLFATLGLLVLHRISLSGITMLVSEALPGDPDASSAKSRLFRLNVLSVAASIGAVVQFVPAGTCGRELPYRNVLFGSVLPTYWYMTSARQFIFAAFLKSNNNNAQDAQYAKTGARVACFLSHVTPSHVLAVITPRLLRLNYTILIDANSSAALAAVNNADTVLVPYGESFMYYAAHWGRSDRVQRFVIVCDLAEQQEMCRPGSINGQHTRFYSFGDNLALRNGEVKYVRAPSPGWLEADDADLLFRGIPAPRSLADTLWMHPQPQAELDRLRQWASKSIAIGRQ